MSFYLAQKISLGIMEWTLDHERLSDNPLNTVVGRSKIKKLCAQNRVTVQSVLSGGCFLGPFWKTKPSHRIFKEDFIKVYYANVWILMLIVPLVDNGRLENQKQQSSLVEFLLQSQNFFQKNN